MLIQCVCARVRGALGGVLELLKHPESTPNLRSIDIDNFNELYDFVNFSNFIDPAVLRWLGRGVKSLEELKLGGCWGKKWVCVLRPSLA